MTDRAQASNAVVILLGGLVLGVLGDLLFYAVPLGVNAALYAAGFLATVAALLRACGVRGVWPNATPAAPALFFAAMFAVVSAQWLLALDALLALIALGLVVRYVSTPRFFLSRHWLAPAADLIELAFVGWFEPLVTADHALKWTRTLKIKREHRLAAQAVVRGCALAIPIVAGFALLLSSADVVFSDLVGDVFGLFVVGDPTTLIAHLTVIFVFAWIGTAALKSAVYGGPAPNEAAADSGEVEDDPASEENKPSASPHAPPSGGLANSLGMIEGGIVLGSVNALFLVFVAIQARYLFGGSKNITETGYTYSEYARRGFFELLVVSIATMLLLLALDHAVRRSAAEDRWFRRLALGVIACALVMLASAFQRMAIYEDAYGFTRLRVVSHVFMVWQAALLIVLAAHLFQPRPQLFWIGAAVAVVGYAATLNLMNVDAFIAQRNIDRFHDDGKIDVYYLTSLSDDAVPALVALLDERDDPDYGNVPWEALIADLSDRLDRLDARRDRRGILGWHFGEARAWGALDDRRDLLATAGP